VNQLILQPLAELLLRHDLLVSFKWPDLLGWHSLLRHGDSAQVGRHVEGTAECITGSQIQIAYCDRIDERDLLVEVDELVWLLQMPGAFHVDVACAQFFAL
jgi:hypothetical protein